MYIEKAELEAFLKRSLTASENSIFSLLEESAGKAINDYTGTTFVEVKEPSERYFDGEGLQDIIIDRCTDISSVVNVDSDNDTTYSYTTSEYATEPYNETVKYSLRKRSGAWPMGIRNIKVTAKFSSFNGGIPKDVKLACLKLVADSITNPLGFKKESLEGYSYDLGQAIKKNEILSSLLAGYRTPDC